ncbi:hypothetical protein TNCV_3948271 [Trichonephila clavipes]|nr:hypothetical protein TNCV_3948271 [Trichonephila clavipes]
MGHGDELTTELQEILNEEHQETQRNVSPEQEEDERGPMPTPAIKYLLKKWADVRRLDWIHIQRHCAVNSIKLKFNPPTTECYYGWWDRLTYQNDRSLLLSIVCIAAMMRSLSSTNDYGRWGTYTKSLTYFRRKKSQGVKSGDLGGERNILSNTLDIDSFM